MSILHPLTRCLVQSILFLVMAMITAYSQENRPVLVGTVQGKITPAVSDDVSEEILRGKRLTRYNNHQHSVGEDVPPYRLSESAVVYIEIVNNAEKFDPPVERPKLNQTQMVFRPLVLPILLGTVVDFPNNDDVFHNVFSYSRPKEFDLGRYPQGNMKSVRFDKPGTVKVYCDIHSYMYSTILVLPHPYFTTPDDEGNFEIHNVPEGNHTLNFWYGRKVVESKKITVKAEQTTIVNFP